jgi:2-isopropylmalate synthase
VLNASGSEALECVATIAVDTIIHEIRAKGNGPIDAFVRALNQHQLASFSLSSYSEHALGDGASTQAVAYIQLQTPTGPFFGAAMDTNIELASIKAVLSALNRSMQPTPAN